MRKGLKGLLITCAVLAGVGMLLLGVGLAGGSAYSLDKISEKYPWIRVGNGQMTTTQVGGTSTQTADTSAQQNAASSAGSSAQQNADTSTGAAVDSTANFTAVKVQGDIHVVIQSIQSADAAGAYAQLQYDEREGMPECTVKDNTLYVDAQSLGEGIYVNFTGADMAPRLMVYVPEGKALESLSVEAEYTDVRISGCTVNTIDVELSAGDLTLNRTAWESLTAVCRSGEVEANRVESKACRIEVKNGDVSLSGLLQGATKISANGGDIEVDTTEQETAYTVTADSATGDVEVGFQEMENGGNISTGSGSYSLDLESKYGDVSVEFNVSANGNDTLYDDTDDFYDDDRDDDDD